MRMTNITWPGEEKKHHPDNIGGVIVFVLFLMAVHDKYGWGRNRFHEMFLDFQKRLEEIVEHGGSKAVHEIYNGLEESGLDEQRFSDFIRRLPNLVAVDPTYKTILGHATINCKRERQAMEDSAWIAYVVLFKIVYDNYKFREKRIHYIQDKLKFYERCITERQVMLVEFMECLRCECNQGYGALDEYTQKAGPLHIYG